MTSAIEKLLMKLCEHHLHDMLRDAAVAVPGYDAASDITVGEIRAARREWDALTGGASRGVLAIAGERMRMDERGDNEPSLSGWVGQARNHLNLLVGGLAGDRRHELAAAGACIAAEIDRLDKVSK